MKLFSLGDCLHADTVRIRARKIDIKKNPVPGSSRHRRMEAIAKEDVYCFIEKELSKSKDYF
ncbi:MAG TPA: hypothetical protein HA367_02575 [Candidatus Methanofastidiosum sp.]|nr:hypothetical protein [Methanofastidiosum sp.]